MPGTKVTLDKPKKVFNKISKLYTDKTKVTRSDYTSSMQSFQATAYVPRFWERVVNISRLFLFLIIISLLLWFTVGSDLFYSFQKKSFEKNELTGFYKNNKPDFQQFYGFVSVRSEKLTNLAFNKANDNFEVTIEDQNMSKQSRPNMVMHVENSPWRKNDYEKVVNGELFIFRNERERTIEKDWIYDFKLTENQQVQPDILAYLNTNQKEFSATLTSLKTIGQSFEIYPDSIVTTLSHHKFGKYRLVYSEEQLTGDQWYHIDKHVFFKRAPKTWTED